MGRYIGVDWASGCWVVVDFEGEPMVSTAPSILNVWHQFKEDAEVILVDIPIGLAEHGRRACDEKAREIIGSRSSTVFSVPVESAVDASGYQSARDANIEGGFGGLGSQSWGLVPRIREVDIFLEEHPDAAYKVFESHPEVCFAKLMNDQLNLPSKNTDEGRDKRLRILREEAPEFGRDINKFVRDRLNDPVWHQKIQSGRVNDVIDAAVLALTAKLATERDFPRLPSYGDYDTPPVIIHP